MCQAIAGLNTDQFSSHIDELNLLLLDFQSLLEKESDELKGSDASALSASTQAKALLTNKIDLLVKQINKSLPASTQNKHFFELAQQNAFSDISNSLQASLNKSMALSQTCHDLNMANGMAIQILSNINQVSLQILTGQNQSDSSLYGSSGSTTQNKPKSSLGKA